MYRNRLIFCDCNCECQYVPEQLLAILFRSRGGRCPTASAWLPLETTLCEFWCQAGVCDGALLDCDIVWYVVRDLLSVLLSRFVFLPKGWAKCRNNLSGSTSSCFPECWLLRFGGGSHGGEVLAPLGTMVPQNGSPEGGAAHGPRHPLCF